MPNRPRSNPCTLELRSPEAKRTEGGRHGRESAPKRPSPEAKRAEGGRFATRWSCAGRATASPPWRSPHHLWEALVELAPVPPWRSSRRSCEVMCRVRSSPWSWSRCWWRHRWTSSTALWAPPPPSPTDWSGSFATDVQGKALIFLELCGHVCDGERRKLVVEHIRRRKRTSGPKLWYFGVACCALILTSGQEPHAPVPKFRPSSSVPQFWSRRQQLNIVTFFFCRRSHWY
jgi:hypothetical protein